MLRRLHAIGDLFHGNGESLDLFVEKGLKFTCFTIQSPMVL